MFLCYSDYEYIKLSSRPPRLLKSNSTLHPGSFTGLNVNISVVLIGIFLWRSGLSIDLAILTGVFSLGMIKSVLNSYFSTGVYFIILNKSRPSIGYVYAIVDGFRFKKLN